MMLNLLPVGRALSLMSQLALVVLQTLFGSLSKMRSLKLSTIRTDSKRLHASIDADSGGCLDLTARLLADSRVDKDGCVVLPVWVHGYSNILDLAVKTTIQDNRDILALRNAESLMFPINGAALRIMKGLSVLLAFRNRVVCPMLPPILEGISNLLDSVLQSLGVDFAEPGIDGLQRYKLSLGTIITNTDSGPTPHHRHIVQCAIVCHAATAEALREELRLFLSRIKPVFIRSQHITNLLTLCLIVN